MVLSGEEDVVIARRSRSLTTAPSKSVSLVPLERVISPITSARKVRSSFAAAASFSTVKTSAGALLFALIVLMPVVSEQRYTV